MSLEETVVPKYARALQLYWNVAASIDPTLLDSFAPSCKISTDTEFAKAMTIHMLPPLIDC